MGVVNREFLERYQKLWEMDKESRAFAPLAEAYRKEGKLEEALQVCRYGIHRHPQFSGGWVQLAKINIDMHYHSKAIEALTKAVELSPENILAHSLLADLYLHEKKPKEALKSFKMVLLLHPEDKKARKSIERLESLTADEYSPEVFQIEPSEKLVELSSQEKHPFDQEMEDIFSNLNEQEKSFYPTKVENISSKQRGNRENRESIEKDRKDFSRLYTKTITLVEALMVRNEFEKARVILEQFTQKWGASKEIEDLKEVLLRQSGVDEELVEMSHPSLPQDQRRRHEKIKKLEKLLEKVKSFQKN